MRRTPIHLISTTQKSAINKAIMKKEGIRHRRLYAFFESKVLNVLMITVVTSLLLMAYTQSMLLPVICSTIALICFIGYAIWLWVKKPQRIIINRWLSGINGCFTLYFIIIMPMEAPNEWWYIIPICLIVCILCFSLICNKDELYEICWIHLICLYITILNRDKNKNQLEYCNMRFIARNIVCRSILALAKMESYYHINFYRICLNSCILHSAPKVDCMETMRNIVGYRHNICVHCAILP